ncbi:hypothetical protein BDN70DRAFT_673993 [Pholiota conissans]|uniref:Uncharacterized protein n=1 Tax=Pholiota conissans TaxID=109636 RepID=A0A9P5Z1E3_9AGAR|nr:hypothetical protein BDN70DRAFT_673993 [Pholiota conissans]
MGGEYDDLSRRLRHTIRPQGFEKWVSKRGSKKAPSSNLFDGYVKAAMSFKGVCDDEAALKNWRVWRDICVKKYEMEYSNTYTSSSSPLGAKPFSSSLSLPCLRSALHHSDSSRTYPDVVKVTLKTHEPSGAATFAFRLADAISSAWDSVIVKGGRGRSGRRRFCMRVRGMCWLRR